MNKDTALVFLDSNVPMYLIGAEHQNKHAASKLISDMVSRGERLVTDAEVFQEILHRYSAINRMDAIDVAFNLLRSLVAEVFPMDIATVDTARGIIHRRTGLSARDAIHLASMQIHEVSRIVSFDTDFDRVPNITRLC